MTKRISVIIMTLFLFAFTNKTYIDFTIIPGQGFGPVKIGKSTKKDIEKYLGKGRLEEQTFEHTCIRINGKKTFTETHLIYDSLGLEFEFEDDNVNKPIITIEFKNKIDWKIQGGFRINHTTRKEVYDKLKFPTNGQNEVAYIDYDSLGIGYYFKYYDEPFHHKYLPTDTLVNVLIYEKED